MRSNASPFAQYDLGRFWAVILGCLLIVTASCSIQTQEFEVAGPTGEVAALYADATVYPSDGLLYVKAIPPSLGLGMVFELVQKKLGANRYNVWNEIDHNVFTKSIVKEDYEDAAFPSKLRKDQAYAWNDGSLASLMSYFEVSRTNTVEIQARILAERAYVLKTQSLEVKRNYCDPDRKLYYVHEVVVGSISYFGLKRLDLQLSFAGAGLSRSSSFNVASSLHEVRSGIIAMKPYPVRNALCHKEILKEAMSVSGMREMQIFGPWQPSESVESEQDAKGSLLAYVGSGLPVKDQVAIRRDSSTNRLIEVLHEVFSTSKGNLVESQENECSKSLESEYTCLIWSKAVERAYPPLDFKLVSKDQILTYKSRGVVLSGFKRPYSEIVSLAIPAKSVREVGERMISVADFDKVK